jgi:hypothetical protein
LPSWFDLAKYRNTKNLTCLDWYWQLSARAHLWSFVTWEVPSNFYEKFPGNPVAQQAQLRATESRALLDSIRRCPIIDKDSFRDGRPLFGEIIPTPDFGVRSTSIADIAKQMFYIRSDERARALDVVIQGLPIQGETLVERPLVEVQRESLDEMLISVQLDVPERLLIENFAAFVRRAKATRDRESEEGSRYRTPDFSQWARIGILPFFDLKIWELQENVSIPNRVMADAIFELEHMGGEETVRKTTEKLAYQVLEGDVLKALATLHATQRLETDNHKP